MLSYIVLTIGAVLIIFGLRLMFQKGYVERKYGSLEEQEDHWWFKKKDAYLYNKYLRGIEAIVLGLILVLAALKLL